MFNKDYAYTFLDVETGGLDPKKHSLLTGCALILSQDLRREAISNVVFPIATYSVTPEALQVNGIDLSDLRPSKRKDVETFFDIINNSCYVVGHNVSFDLAFLREYANSNDIKLNSDIRIIDTKVLTHILQSMGKLPLTESSRLTALSFIFDISHEEAHTAEGDVLANVEVYKCLMKILKSQ